MQKIQNYAIIGNGRSAALVSRDGSIDWLCWPRFDSPSLFANILDTQIGGSWKIAPLAPALIERRYIVWAAYHYRREWYIGGSTVLAIIGDKIASGIGDWYLARKGYDIQQYDGIADQNRANNLYDPVEGNYGAHGDFDCLAFYSSFQIWISRYRKWLFIVFAILFFVCFFLLLF